MRKILRILLISSFVWYFGSGLLGPLYAIFVKNIGGDILEITWAYAAYLSFYGNLSIFVGKFSKNQRRMKYIMLLGYLINSFATFSYLFVNDPISLFAVQISLGIALALATPTWDALYSLYEERKFAAFEWSLASGIPAIITALAIILGGYIVQLFGFNILFVSMGVVQIISTMIVFGIVFSKT